MSTSVHLMRFGRGALVSGLIFFALVVLWKAIFLLESCVGRLNAQPDFDRSDLAWCTGSMAERWAVPGPPPLAHHLSLVLLALVIVGLWRGAIAAGQWWSTSRMRQWIASRSGRVVFALRYVLVLAVCAIVNGLVPIVEPCVPDFLYSPAAGFHCQFFQDKLLPVPLSLVPTGPPLPVAALFIVIVWYAYDASRVPRS